MYCAQAQVPIQHRGVTATLRCIWQQEAKYHPFPPMLTYLVQVRLPFCRSLDFFRKGILVDYRLFHGMCDVCLLRVLGGRGHPTYGSLEGAANPSRAENEPPADAA